MNHDEHLDNLLDQALSEYREAEPLAGLEDRVLQRLMSQPQKQISPWLRWGVAAAAAAALSLAIWLAVQGRRGHNDATEPQAAGQSTQAPQAPVAPREASAAATLAIPKHSRATAGSQPARLTASTAKGALPPQFPVPVPLSGDELAFMAALEQNGEALRASSNFNEPVAIAEIEIKPLSSINNDSGENQ
jgi:cytoskeletal protein RodZ